MSEALFAIAVVVVFGFLVMHYELKVLNLEVELLAQRDALELEQPQMCGATDGDLVCSLEPHATDWHIDFSKTTQYRSATFHQPKLAIPDDYEWPAFTPAEIERWN